MRLLLFSCHHSSALHHIVLNDRETGALTHSARREIWFVAERDGRNRKAEFPSWLVPSIIFRHTFSV